MSKSLASTFLFDGNCVLCSRGVRYVLRYETHPNTRFVAILSEEGRELASRHGIDPENPKSFLWVEDNQPLAASDAVFALLRHVGGPAKILLIGKILPKSFRDWVYDRIAKNRYKIFGRTESCYVPSPENRERFVVN